MSRTSSHSRISRNSSVSDYIGTGTRNGLSSSPNSISANAHTNSLNNFLSSFKRSQSFTGQNVDVLSNSSIYEEDVLEEEGTMNETTGLIRLPANKSRRGSIISSYTIITGNSTLPQTVFNSINVLIGIALLSLPYALRLSGVVIGTMMIVGCYSVTVHTARILGEILRKKPHLVTYGDIAGYAYGPGAQLAITSFFMFDITGALISLSLLFSSSFAVLFPLSESTFKVIIYTVMFFLTFVPLNYLSMSSLAGVASVFTMVVLIFICGFTTPDSPGSLINPMPINLFPTNGSVVDVLLSIGMFMAPWGGHPVFPELYKDMKHSFKYERSCGISFTFTVIVDYAIALIGLLMFGMECQDVLIKNIMSNDNYPEFVKPCFLIIMGILPMSKMPLLAKPIITTYENYFELNKEKMTIVDIVKKLSARVLYVVLSLGVSLMVKSFGKVVAFFGSSVCFALCMVFPYLFKLKILKDEISKTETIWLWSGVIFGTVIGALGTLGVVIGV
ncbi:hypothetical protein PSN45_004972 [Yamadazyma tenuis]|uniref:Amino acid transporter transmembrane domain-containing protein n=1 Tax=Candida tenuis (strain ATCC 10573 / BCRC 21748 / CBS 615 / JCM 9827 / NBRC 10315 / NRRL Y-1498 / VKM Y-70) TaxID=590646 RepID=G3B2B8_CANTC|nr:uncharacterized protein CANTEDRAFT_113420 [Yamadazyma tenuis ATCC 10573]XP_006685884.1 uncharacterized protein CANTEDRAFT_113420 [Yamadazyma tenuis ATCC 10573]EGV65077.1 hypothetical protein CANTEDRAFT_113420 [Yamadazyma tenuis ATCC 10573]EGV65078.1 hypothetical protein CANTEDRAFT_113420 [Yamadazyma tenuis ATCC 10573]WEJ97421.1 hypothetical protein PSN45_004972 [Yamadazyma tenuis]